MYHVLENNQEINKVIDYIATTMKDTVFTVSYANHCHFPNEKPQDIRALRHAHYVLTINKNGRDYSFDFYAAIANSYRFGTKNIKLYGENLSTVKEELKEYHVPDFQVNNEHNPLEFQRIQESTKNHQKYVLTSILGSLVRDINCPSWFDDFCCEYGFDNDSITAKKIWESVIEQNSKVERCFNSKQLQKLQKLLENF